MSGKTKTTQETAPVKWKNILKSRNFRSFFIFTGIAVSLLFLIAAASIAYGNIRKTRENMEAQTNAVIQSIQEQISSAKTSAILIGTLPSIRNVLYDSDPTINNLYEVSDDLSQFAMLYNYRTTCIFFEKSKRIYDSNSGIYYYNDYYNKELTDSLHEMQGNESWIINHANLRNNNGDGRSDVTLLTYIRQLPVYGTQTYGYVTVSISLSYLQGLAAEAVSGAEYPVALYFRDQLLWCSSSEIMNSWDYDETVSANLSALLPRKSEFSSSTGADTKCTFYLSGIDCLNLALQGLPMLFCIYLAAMALIFTAAFLYAMITLYYMDTIMTKIGTLSYMESDASSNEYSMLDTAFDSLSVQMNDIRQRLSDNERLIRQQMLRSLIYEQVNPLKISENYRDCGITFPYPHFCLILINGLNQMPDLTQICEETAGTFSPLGVSYGINMGDGNIAVILNTTVKKGLQNRIFDICNTLRRNIKKKASPATLSILFSVIFCSDSDPDFYQAWKRAQRNFAYTTDEADNFIFFDSQGEYVSSLDETILIHLSQSIINGDGQSLKEYSDMFYEKQLSCAASIEEARKLTTAALCTIFTRLLSFDIDIKNNLLTGYLTKISQAASIQECYNAFFGCLFLMIGNKTRISDTAHSYVRSAVSYLEEHYKEDITVIHVADHVGVNSIYLNRIFKQSTGKTLSEYLNYYRTSRSLVQLEDDSVTIQKISEEYGYHDVRSYIRFFRKFYGMTPTEYRKAYFNK